MRFGLVQTLPPAQEPVLVADAKAHCRVQTGLDDAYLGGLIAAARQRVELETGRQLVTASWRLTLDTFPPDLLRDRHLRDRPWDLDRDAVALPRAPLQSVTSVTYLDTAGVLQTLDPSRYLVDAAMHPGRVMPAWGTIWPVARYQSGSVRVDYVAGYGDPTAVPAPLRQAVLMLVAHWYDAREAVAAAGQAEVPLAFDWLVQPYWCGEVR